MTAVRLTTTTPDEVRADALVLFVERDGDKFTLRAAGELPRATVTKLRALLTPVLGAMAVGDVRIVPSSGAVRAETVAFTATEDMSAEALRRAAGAALRELAGRRTVAIAVPVAGSSKAAAIAQGARLGAYTFSNYRSGSTTSPATSTITLCSPAARKAATKKALAEANTVTDAVVAVRDLVNTPPGDLPPTALAAAVRRAASDTPVRVDVWDERKLARGGYGGMLGVGQGSANPPRLVKLSYHPPKARGHLGLVGKGVTFDSGGLSLKAPTAMITMKCDMAGAAAVAMATLAVARLKIPVRITAYLALAENMPSGTAQRPGDVLTTYNGTTVEVLNTDAEGRLLMADVLAKACEDSPDLLIDVATLTGAQMVALGMHVAAAMGNRDDARDRVVTCADAADEAMWAMPLPPQLRASLDSRIADLANIGERMGGMLTAGVFLSEFVDEGIPWVHLDIAGPAFNEGPAVGYTPTGGTGYAVRTLVQVARDMAG
ncbi:MAG: leucyl aminopeptidase [Actinomycetota bacterium]|nr:leucyl aminopeptidase [Actinomycetota bacterium]